MMFSKGRFEVGFLLVRGGGGGGKTLSGSLSGDSGVELTGGGFGVYDATRTRLLLPPSDITLCVWFEVVGRGVFFAEIGLFWGAEDGRAGKAPAARHASFSVRSLSSISFRIVDATSDSKFEIRESLEAADIKGHRQSGQQ